MEQNQDKINKISAALCIIAGIGLFIYALFFVGYGSTTKKENAVDNTTSNEIVEENKTGDVQLVSDGSIDINYLNVLQIDSFYKNAVPTNIIKDDGYLYEKYNIEELKNYKMNLAVEMEDDLDEYPDYLIVNEYNTVYIYNGACEEDATITDCVKKMNTNVKVSDIKRLMQYDVTTHKENYLMIYFNDNITYLKTNTLYNVLQEADLNKETIITNENYEVLYDGTVLVNEQILKDNNTNIYVNYYIDSSEGQYIITKDNKLYNLANINEGTITAEGKITKFVNTNDANNNVDISFTSDGNCDVKIYLQNEKIYNLKIAK